VPVAKFFSRAVVLAVFLRSIEATCILDIIVNDKSTFAVEQKNGQPLLAGTAVDWDVSMQPNGLVSIIMNGRSFTAIIEEVDRKEKKVMLRINGRRYTAAIKEPIDRLLANMGMDVKATRKIEPVKAPMPGMVLKVLVTPGQVVNAGDGLVILEAMKMENVLKAGASATVKAIKVNERTAVEKGAVLIELA
jgi:biotin carboxyl carrier protein